MKNRNIAAVIALSFITFGIYTLFWLNSTRNEMVARGAKIPSIGWIIAAVIGLIPLTILVLVVAIASLGGSGNEAAFGSIIAFLVLAFIYPLVGIGIGYWIYRYCQGVEHVTNGQTSVALSMSMWAVLNFLVGFGFVWPGIIQDGLNKVTEGSPAKADSQPAVNTANQSPASDPSPATAQLSEPANEPSGRQPVHDVTASPSDKHTAQPTENVTPTETKPVGPATAPPVPNAKHDTKSTGKSNEKPGEN